MPSSLSLAIILTFVGLIIFILISMNDLGVTTLKTDTKSHSTLLGMISTGLPVTTILDQVNKMELEETNINNLII